jgi:hypothetical protein
MCVCAALCSSCIALATITWPSANKITFRVKFFAKIRLLSDHLEPIFDDSVNVNIKQYR